MIRLEKGDVVYLDSIIGGKAPGREAIPYSVFRQTGRTISQGGGWDAAIWLNHIWYGLQAVYPFKFMTLYHILTDMFDAEENLGSYGMKLITEGFFLGEGIDISSFVSITIRRANRKEVCVDTYFIPKYNHNSSGHTVYTDLEGKLPCYEGTMLFNRLIQNEKIFTLGIMFPKH